MDALLFFVVRQKYLIIYTTEDMMRVEFKMIFLPIGQQKAIIDSVSIETVDSDNLPEGFYEFKFYHQRNVVKSLSRITRMKKMLTKEKYITFPGVSPDIFTDCSYIDDPESISSLFYAAETIYQKKKSKVEISDLFDDFTPFFDYCLVDP